MAVRLAVILGSTRPNRFGDRVADWVMQEVARHPGFEAELLDLRDFPLPFYEETTNPAYNEGVYGHPVATEWAARIASADAFVIVTAEYNHSFTAVLKNALDHAYREWNNKPVAFVGYGGVGGARAVEQLRLVTIELQMAPIRNAVHVPGPVYAAVRDGGRFDEFDYLVKSAEDLLRQLHWWTVALKDAREAAS